MLLEAHQITKYYGAQRVLHNVSIHADQGEIVCLLGPSGCGKSTLLRVVAGLEQDYTGSIQFAGRAIDRVPVHERGFGFMFQDFALLPHRSVGDNIAFGLRMQRLPRAEIERRVAAMLDLVGLPSYARRTIFELSGGERQRVALARSLAPQPKLLMLDEPLGALDRTLRERLTDDLRTIIKRVGLTGVYVTHDQVEAFAVADRIVLMDRGQIVQSGTPAEVYQQPHTLFAAQFLGLNNLIDGRVRGRNAAQASVDVETVLGVLHVASALPATDHITVLIRPEAAMAATPSSRNLIEGAVVRTTFRGSSQRVVIQHASGAELAFDLDPDIPITPSMRLALRPDALTLLTVGAPTTQVDS